MYFKRAIENVLNQTEKSFKAVLVTGARQVGKSTLLKHNFPDIPYLTFDDPVLRDETLREPGLFFKNNRPPLILDEVQYITGLFPYIKIICDNSNINGLIRMTGSQQFHLMKNVSESLAGRIAILELMGLSLRERNGDAFNKPFLATEEYINERASTVKNEPNLWEKIHRGTYPALLDESVDWQTFYSSYLQTYIERDVNELGNIKNKQKFTQFMTVIAAHTGQMINYSAIAEVLEISNAKVKEWISILEASGIVFILQPFSNSALRKAIKTPKLYFKDTGLACYLTKYQNPEIAKNGAMAGALFETFVVSEIVKSYANAGLDYRMYLYYYRGRDKLRRLENGEKCTKEAEIDLVIEQGETLFPIEIKMSANPKLSMTNAFDILDKIPGKTRGLGCILCMYDKPLWLNEKTVALPIEYV